MNKIIALIAALFSLAPCLMARESSPDTDYDSRYKLAISMFDSGKYEAALQELDYLVEKNPTNWDYLYERAFTLYSMQRYDKAIVDCKNLVKMRDCKWPVYQLWGSCLDYQDKPNEAVEIFRKGIERFPDAPYLYQEIGTTYLRYQYYDQAINWYNKAIEIDPDFQPGYYRGAISYASTGDNAWALIYAETSIILRSDNDVIYNQMSNLIRDVYENSIIAEGDSLTVKLCESRDIQIEEDGSGETDPFNKANTLLAFSGVYEACLASALNPNDVATKDPANVLTLRGLTNLRRVAVETYYNITDNLYGNSMYLLEFQKSVIDTGHWDAYNAYILMPAFPDEAGKWFDDHKQELDAFLQWYTKSQFKLDKQHTVGALNITRDERRLTMVEALHMLAELLRAQKNEPK